MIISIWFQRLWAADAEQITKYDLVYHKITNHGKICFTIQASHFQIF